jgi:hypothetical protein
MTIDEALERIAGTRNCWVVWREDSGEIVSVTGWDHSPTREQFGQSLTSMGNGATSSTKGRFLESAKVTRGLLEAEVRETARTRERVSIYNQWATAPTERLVGLLDGGDYAELIGPSHGRDYLIRLLYRLRWHELGPFRDRLVTIAGRDPRDPSERTAWLQLAQYLAVFDGDVERLILLYRGRPRWSCLIDFLECFGDARIRDPILVWQIINIVDAPGMFGPRYEAMVALGKIGRFAGPRTVEVIQRRIFDSSESVRNLRERVLRRIQTPSYAWEDCPHCCRGWVSMETYSIAWPGPCPTCLGLGVVEVAAHGERHRRFP